ncbi:homeobox-domain-containing protein [Phlegmacium glaucopus]|nr:homeobox-domain-containing protein [Phlegmacium glaucopus]
MYAQPTFNAERDAMRKFQRTARTTVAILEGYNAGFHISKPSPVLDTSSMTLDLTLPHDIFAPIMKLPEGIRQEFLGCFMNRLNGLQEQFLSIFRSTCSMARSVNDLDAIRQGVRSIYYRQYIPLFQLQLSRLADLPKPQQQNHSGKKTFNNEYTPLLEKYFEHNAYPSASDRLVLATKTMMTPRQIEVWFQNHRNRAKKEGKLIKRSSSNQPLELSLKSFESATSLLTVSKQESFLEDSSSEDSAVEDIVSQPTSSVDVFSCVAPPHAFPTRYPPKCAGDPFPNGDGIFRFAPPVWRRCPAAASATPSSPVNLDELVAMFASKLSLRESCLSTVQSRQKTPNSFFTGRKPWFAATVTIAPRAPHPALLRTSCVPPPPRTIAPPTSIPSIETSWCSRSRSVIPATLTLCQVASKPRKLAPLPRRTPATSPFTSYTSSSPTPSSRTSSSSSATSSRSTSSCSSSLTDPVRSPSPVIQAHIQAQSPVITDDLFDAFHEYINTKLQPGWTDLGLASIAFAKQASPFSQYQSSTLPDPSYHYLEVQS